MMIECILRLVLQRNDAHMEAMNKFMLIERWGVVRFFWYDGYWGSVHALTITKNRAAPLKRQPGFSGWMKL